VGQFPYRNGTIPAHFLGNCTNPGRNNSKSGGIRLATTDSCTTEGTPMSFNFQISSKAAFDTSAADALRERLFGKPRQSTGLRANILVDDKPATAGSSFSVMSDRRTPENTPKNQVRLRKAEAPQAQPPISEAARRRLPVEYLGHLITNEQQADGKWVASFARMGGPEEAGRRTAPHPASHMAFADAKAQIDATLSDPSTGQREFQRFPVALDGMIFAAGATHACQLIDLSAGGARLHPAHRPTLTGDLVLFIQSFGRYRAQIIRSTQTEMSVRFMAEEETVLSLLKGLSTYVKGFDTPHIKLRKETRVAAPMPAVCRDANGVAIPCEIVNASLRSMSITMTQRPQIGTLVMLGRTRVRVMRHHDNGIAVQCLPVPTVRSGRFVFSEICASDAAVM